MSDFLEQVIAERRLDVAAARLVMPDDQIHAVAQVGAIRPFDQFYQAIRRRRSSIAVIAEVKRISPASGVLVENFDPVAQARRYVAAGATAISVLTEGRHWGGSLDDLVAIRDAVDVPLLAKDVIVDPYQIYEARAAGADAVLLIAEALDDALLRELVSIAKRLGMSALVEAHEASAFGRGVASGAQVVAFVHADQILVAESGITSIDDARMLPARVDAVLVGTALMRSDDPGQLIQGIASIHRPVHA